MVLPPLPMLRQKTLEPVREELVAMLGPFINTLVICTMTALVIIISGLYYGSNLTGATLSSAAFDQMLPGIGKQIVSFGLVFFAFTTMVAWSYYGDRSVKLLFKGYGTQAVKIYRWIYVIIIPIGATASLPLVWNLSDIANGLMAFPNLIALIGLAPIVARLLKNYEERLPGMKPVRPSRLNKFFYLIKTLFSHKSKS